jgi:hypothetical protein
MRSTPLQAASWLTQNGRLPPSVPGAILVIATLSLLTATAAEGRARRRLLGVIVLPDSPAEASAARVLQRKLVKALAKDRYVLPVDPLRALTDSPLIVSQEVRSRVEAGHEALARGRYREAAARLGKALRSMQGNVAKVPKAMLADVTLHLAAAHLGLGKRRLAERTLRELLTWRQGHPLTPRCDPPHGWDESTQRARSRLEAAPVGSIQVSTVPPHAEAFVDGRRLGPTPTLVSNLKVGTHYLTLKLEGHKRTVMPIRARRRRTSISVRLHPEEPAHGLVRALHELRPGLGRPRLRFPSILRQQLGLSAALVVVVKGRDQLLAYLYRLADRRLLTQTAINQQLPLKKEQLQVLALWRGSSGSDGAGAGQGIPVYRPGPGTGDGRRRSSRGGVTISGPWYTRWWVWGLVGAVVAAGVVIPIAVIDRDEAPPTERFQITW